MYGSDKGYKGKGQYLSKAGVEADKAGGGGTSNDGTSTNFALEGSVLKEILKEFPATVQEEKKAWGSPFVWFEEKDGAKKKRTVLGGVDDLKAYASKNFADDAAIQKQNVNPMSYGRGSEWGILNMFNNYSPGYTVPDPLPTA